MSECVGTQMEGKKFNTKQKRLHVTAETAISLKADAHKITLHLIENEVNADFLKDKIRYITPEQYGDVVTERALNEICGYPLCNLRLTPQYVSQTYIIRHNKVYDITQRKNFCSHKCYEASNIIANQVPKVPLYLRGSDKQITNFELFIPDQSTLHGRYGTLVNIKGCIEDEDEVIAKQQIATNETCKTTKKTEKEYEKNSCSTNVKDIHKVTCTQSLVPTDKDSKLYPKDNKSLNCDIKDKKEIAPLDEHSKYKRNNKQHKQNKKSLKDSSTQDDNAKSLNENNAILNNTKPLDLLLEVEQWMRQWVTFESLRLILGDKYVRGMLEELGKTWEDYDTSAGLCLSIEGKSRYIALCKKLNFMEMEEEICEKSLPSMEESNIASKPMPNFDQLKMDVDEHTIKVKAFFEGKEEFATTARGDNLETVNEENEEENKSEAQRKKDPKARASKKKKNSKLEEYLDSEFVTLPLIDAYTQGTWRRHIVLEKISKPIAALSCQFDLDEGQIRNLLKPLIASFDLTAHNIIFRVIQWDYVALILLKMLGVRYTVINDAMRSNKGCKVIASLLSKTDVDICYLDRLLSYLTEIVYVLSKYHNNSNCSGDKSSHEASTYHDVTKTEDSTSNVNFGEKTSDSMVCDKVTTNSSQLSESELSCKSLEGESVGFCDNSCLKDSANNLIPTTLENKQNKSVDSPIAESDFEKEFSDKVNCINKTNDIKFYTDTQEILTKTSNLNLSEKVSTNMEELD